MEVKHCLATVKTEYNRLTKKEKQLADYVLENYESVISMPTAELADKAGVVKSVVVRFCQSLGFSGYTEFKLMLSREAARNEQFNFTPYISKQDEPEDIFEKIFASNIKTLRDTAEGLDRKIFRDAVETLEKANGIYIYGIGTSAGMVRDFRYRLMEIGKSAYCFTDIVDMTVSLLNIKPQDVAIGISNSGRTSATVDALKTAHENGAKTICLTGYPNSEIIKHSDYPLVIRTDEIQYPIEAISARTAHMSVLDSIAISLSSKRYDEAAERAAKTHDLVNKLRY